MSRRTLLQVARLLSAILCSLLLACNDTSPIAGLSPEEISLPIETMVHDIQDRPLEIRLHYREIDTFHFTRLSDGREFDLPIAKLSRADKRWILKLPVSTPTSRAETRRGAQAMAVIRDIEEDIDLIGVDIQKLNDEIRLDKLSNSQIRRRNGDIYNKRMEIQDKMAEIREQKALLK